MSSSELKIKRSHSLSSISRLKLEDKSNDRGIYSQAHPVRIIKYSGVTLNKQYVHTNTNLERQGRQRAKRHTVSVPRDNFPPRATLGRKHRSLPSLMELEYPLTRSTLKIYQLTGGIPKQGNYHIENKITQQPMSVFSSDSSSFNSTSEISKSTKDKSSRENTWRTSRLETLDLPSNPIAEETPNNAVGSSVDRTTPGIDAPKPLRPINTTRPLLLPKQYSSDLISLPGGLNLPEAEQQLYSRSQKNDLQRNQTTRAPPKPQPLKIPPTEKLSILRRASKRVSGLTEGARENFKAGMEVVSPVFSKSSSVLFASPNYISPEPKSSEYSSSVHTQYSPSQYSSSQYSPSPLTPVADYSHSQPHTPSRIPPQPPTIREESEEGDHGKPQKTRTKFALRSPKTNHDKKPVFIRQPLTPYPDQTQFSDHDEQESDEDEEETPTQDDEEEEHPGAETTPTQSHPMAPSTTHADDSESHDQITTPTKSRKLTRMFSFTGRGSSRTKDVFNGKAEERDMGIITNKERADFEGPGTPSPWINFGTLSSPVKEKWSVIRDRLNPNEVRRQNYKKRLGERKREIDDKGGILRPGRGVEPQDPNTGRVPVWI